MSKSMTSTPGISYLFLIITVANTANITINTTNANNVSDNIIFLLLTEIYTIPTMNITPTTDANKKAPPRIPNNIASII